MIAGKPFTWSYSSLKKFELCPRQWEWQYIHKNKEPETPQMLEGKIIHSAMEHRCGAQRAVLPSRMGAFEKWGVSVDKARAAGMEVLVEQKVGLTRDMRRTGFFDRDVWLRIGIDCALVGKTVAVQIDWKTGKSGYEDATQLQLFAGVGFVMWPAIELIKTKYVWLKEWTDTSVEYTRAESHEKIWQPLLKRVARMESEVEAGLFPPRSSWACSRCPVTECEFHK